MKEPLIGQPIDLDDVLKILNEPGNAELISWVMRDWAEADGFLREQGAPDETEEGNWNPMVERIKHLLGGKDNA